MTALRHPKPDPFLEAMRKFEREDRARRLAEAAARIAAGKSVVFPDIEAIGWTDPEPFPFWKEPRS